MSAEVRPASGEHEQVAKDLLSLAETPWDVQTNTDNGLVFVVPDYLAVAYNEAMADVVPADVPSPKRRGRPRKEL